jgi:raffinose/stachyose/melibiose transport system substrate-binding protein
MRERILNTIGFSLLGLCFVLSLGRILLNKFRPASADGQQQITLRVAHWQLENGVREAFDAIAAEYTKLHPHVKVVQIPIPERIYTNWLITQLVGETAPDLIQLGAATNEERLARYFVPISDLANSPNPYNQGTPLEGQLLRNTFFDGMLGGFNVTLLEYYGVPVSGHSTRMYYNLDLLRQITGSEDPPRTYEELIALCRRCQAYAREHELPFVPIAGSKYNAPFLMNALFSSQTQRMVEDLNPPGRLGPESGLRSLQFLQGKWNLQHPAYRSGLDLLHEIGQYMQPGFIQLLRDDATLTFVQGRSLMICTGSWDATSIRDQSNFKVGVALIPLPSADHPRYGKYTHGSLSEAGHIASVALGLTRNSAHPNVARDFLRFLASPRISQLWADTSGWIPSVIGVTANESVRPFLPNVEGALPGIVPTIEEGGSLPEVVRLVENNFHLLVSPTGSTEAFLKAVEPGYRAALLTSLERRARSAATSAMRSDTQCAALAWLARPEGGTEEDRQRWDRVRQSLASTDRTYYTLTLELDKAAAPSR